MDAVTELEAQEFCVRFRVKQAGYCFVSIQCATQETDVGGDLFDLILQRFATCSLRLVQATYFGHHAGQLVRAVSDEAAIRAETSSPYLPTFPVQRFRIRVPADAPKQPCNTLQARSHVQMIISELPAAHLQR